MPEALITGGSGFLGTALSARLLASGWKLHRLQRKATTLVGHGDHVHIGELNDTRLLAALLDRCDLVIHLASASTPGSTAGRPAEELQSNLAPALHLLEALHAVGGRPVLFVSSGGTLYGDAWCAHECLPPAPLSYHGAAKAGIEAFLHAYQHQTGQAVTALRPSNFYGPGQPLRGGFGLIRTMLEHVRQGTTMTVWGDGEQVRDYLYLDDMVSACLAALAGMNSWQAFNVGSGTGFSINAVRQLIEQETGKTLAIQYAPARSGDVKRIVLDCRAIRERLAWSAQTPLEVGIRKTWSWLASTAA